ncbi:hypothetical protein Cgig2_008262 [Carnegiea gigantea]|uniref:Uncharacterized protein n=1 Tax=Carnegiea gigantea TaxID=171969 RepID=A0A9Q1L2M3_9CARY|nr:hypothetical protein Cgig2_008262 [Carnegiea gigantea]
MVDALKSLMSTMAVAITCQVMEQVKRVVEVTGSARLVDGEETSHRPEGMPSLCPVESGRKGMPTDRSERPLPGRQGGQAAAELVARSARERTTLSATASTPYATHSGRTAWLREQEQTSGPRRQLTTTECRELKKALHELADKGQIDRFLKRGP